VKSLSFLGFLPSSARLIEVMLKSRSGLCRVLFPAALEMLQERIQRQGPGEEVALEHVAAVARQEHALGFVFDPFGDHFEAQAVAERDDGARDRRVVAVIGKITHE